MAKSTFEILDNGIYKAYWKSIEHKELEQYVEWFLESYNVLPSDSVMRVLHDYRETKTPSFNRLRDIMSRHKLRTDIRLRIAHIYSDFLYPVILQNVTLVTSTSANRKFFKPDEEADAIAWLLSE